MKTYELKTIKEGQHDIFKVQGDFMDLDDKLHTVRVYKIDTDGDTLIAAFQDWIYAVELEKPPES